ncbi:virulence-associated E family protein [Bradyrhizobium elkanii]|uniref:virulence-associated E family protein n=1 Tax=Bradyrhizobium elkanii TaxID=29448 RepID=UPI0003F680AD|nr:virulence-associated E family protein [Bradyrhizobium elkanii]
MLDTDSSATEAMQADAAQGHGADAPSLEQAIDFLMLLRPDGPWQLSAINPNVNNDIKTVTATTPDQARGFINRYDGNHNLYYAPNPVRVKDKKASKTEVSAIEFLPGDLDPDEGEAPEDAKARFLAALTSFEPSPMFVVDSGNGVQALWRLSEPMPLPDAVMVTDTDGKTKPALSPEAQAIVDDVEARAKAAMEKLGSVAGTQNIDRILRLPGTVNLPTKAKVKKGRKACQSSLLAYNELAACRLDEFPTPSSVDTRADSSGGTTGCAGTGNPDSVAGSANASIDWTAVQQHIGWLKSADNLPSDFSVRARLIVRHSGNLKDLNFDLQQAGVPNKPYRSWSEVTFALAAIFKSDGRYSNEQIAAALLADLECNQHIANQADKRRAIERAILRSYAEPSSSMARRPGAPNWREQRQDGSPAPSMHNARLAITALGVECSYDTFHNKLLFGFKDDGVRHAVEHIVGEVSDNGIIALRQLMSDTFGFDLTDKHTRDAVISLALEHCFDPVVDMLAAAEAGWDGTERLDGMAVDYFNCEDTKLNRAFLRKTMLAAVARARTPGIKFDQIIVLESAEGFNKSTAWRVLAGDENFSDESIIGKSSREVQEQLAEIWIHENADLAGMKKAEVETVKAYASRMTDIARPAYAHFIKKQKRHSIEVGTTNSDRYLQSQTGNRRFWPLRVLKAIDIEKLRRDRLQLWGEAAHYHSKGESLVLDEALWAEAGVEQEYRRVNDPWEDILRDMKEMTTYRYYQDGAWHEGTRTIIHHEDKEERVSSEELLTVLLNIAPGNQRTEHTMRLATVMKRLGWQRHNNGYVTILGKRMKGYFRAKEAGK